MLHVGVTLGTAYCKAVTIVDLMSTVKTYSRVCVIECCFYHRASDGRLTVYTSELVGYVT